MRSILYSKKPLNFVRPSRCIENYFLDFFSTSLPLDTEKHAFVVAKRQLITLTNKMTALQAFKNQPIRLLHKATTHLISITWVQHLLEATLMSCLQLVAKISSVRHGCTQDTSILGKSNGRLTFPMVAKDSWNKKLRQSTMLMLRACTVERY